MPKVLTNDMPLIVNNDDWDEFEERVKRSIDREREKRNYQSQSKKYYHRFEEE